MKTLVYFLLVTFSLPASAMKEQAPLPAEIKAAKTVYLDNESGMAIVLDYAYRELKKWNRFEITDSPNKADLVLVFTATDERSSSTGLVSGKPVTYDWRSLPCNIGRTQCKRPRQIALARYKEMQLAWSIG